VYGRIVDRPPADELFRKTLGLEQDKLKLCGRHPSKILPIPTLDKEGFHRIVDQHTEMEHIEDKHGPPKHLLGWGTVDNPLHLR
jgi:hypothetical protein